MNIVYKLMSGKPVSSSELKYLLFITLCELQQNTSEEIVGCFDEDECFNINDALDYLEKELGINK